MATNGQEVKRWVFSGIRREGDEKTLREQIEKLGGVVVDRENKYTFFCTHVLVEDFIATEKILAALAAGRWILQCKYVSDSYKRGHWLDERKYEITIQDNTARYCRMRRDVNKGGIYQGWTFYVALGNKNLTRSLRRIITAGDGEIVSDAKLSSVDMIISEKDLVADVRRQVGPGVPIVNYIYIKETLIMKRDASMLERFILDRQGRRVLTRKNKQNKQSPCIIVEDNTRVLPPKRRIEEVSLISSGQKQGPKSAKRSSLTPNSKQTKLDQYLNIGSSSPMKRPCTSGVEILSEASTSKAGTSGVSSRRSFSNDIEIIDLDQVEPQVRKTPKNDDCFITGVTRVHSENRKGHFIKEIEILDASFKGFVKPKIEVVSPTRDQDQTTAEDSKVGIPPAHKDLRSVEDMGMTEGTDESKSVESMIQLNNNCVRQLNFDKGTTDVEMNELPNVDATSQTKTIKEFSLSSKTKVTKITSKSDQKDNQVPTISEEPKPSPEKTVLNKEDIDKLPEKLKRSIDPQKTHLRYSTENMKQTIMSFIEHTKIINQVGMYQAHHFERSCTNPQQLNQSQSEQDDDLTHLFDPFSNFQRSTQVRELSVREVAYFVSSTDEDIIDSNIGQNEKTIIIMGMLGLKNLITPYTYPPASTFGFLLQRIAFETPFRLAHTRAIDLSYLILIYFPPVSSQRRKYYVDVLKAAAQNEKNFYDKLYLPWKFILRPIEALMTNVDPSDDSSMSSENDAVSQKENALGLLNFIVTLLSEDLKQPNHSDAVREHITWQIFWGQSQDPKEITPPIKKLLACWMSLTNASMDVRHCLAKLVSMVMELAWRSDRCLLIPISPQPRSFDVLATFLNYRMQECNQERLMQLLFELPTPWAKSIFGSIIFHSEAQISTEINLGNLVEYGLLTQKPSADSRDMFSDATNKQVKSSSSPTKKHQKNINKRGSNGETKLIHACIAGNVKKVQELLSVPGIDVNLADNSGSTPLHEAAIRGHDSCIKALLKYDCSDSVDMKNTLHLYLRRANYYSCNVRVQSEDGQTALHNAVKNEHLSTAKLLLNHGGDALLNIINKKNKTPLMLCHSQEMKKLLKSYKGKSSLQDSKRSFQFGKSQLNSGREKEHRLLPSPEHRWRFILTLINNFLEASGVRFCRYDMMVQSYNFYVAYKRNHSQDEDFEGSCNLSRASSSGRPKVPAKLIDVIPVYDTSNLTEAELENFKDIYERLVSSMRLCRDLTATVQESVDEPDFILALRNLVL